MTEQTSPGPLAGIRVADLTTLVMGPMASRAMADLGADVIKVEAPGGDMMRDFEPMRSEGMSAFNLALNRNKRSVVFDLKTSAGRAALLDLIATCDVFVTNIRPVALAKLELDDAALRVRRPDLIYCSATGFGSDGPYAAKAAYDDVIQAASGMASMFTWRTGEPAYVPSVIADKVAGLHITQAVLAALYRRTTTGEGEFIEVPMAESLATFNLVEHQSGHTFRPPIGDFGYLRLQTEHRRPRRSADGWVCVLPYTNQNWHDFFALAGRPELADDERFASVNSRVEHVDALYGLMDDIIATRTTAEWMESCDARSIPAVPVIDLELLADDPHFNAVGLLVDHEHPTEGPYRAVRDPIRYRSGSPGLFRHAPQLGEHTREVLHELGYDDGRISIIIGD